MAIQSQLPILPVVYSSYSSFLDDKNKILGNGTVIISCLPEISTEGMTLENLDELMQYTKDLMTEKFNETTKEIQLSCKAPLTINANNNIKETSQVRNTNGVKLVAT